MACILILEDDEISARLAARMLSMRGNEVFTAGTSSTAWTRMQETPIDVLLLDSELEGEHGWEFLARIREDVIFKELPVVVYSSVSRREVVQRYLVLGVQGILVKPTSADRLNQEVNRVTQRPWRDKLFEKIETVQARTGLMSTEVKRLCREAADDLRKALPEIGALVEDTANASGLARVKALKSCALNIGFLRLAEIFEGIQKAVGAKDSTRVKALVERLPTALHLLVMQAGSEGKTGPAADAEGGRVDPSVGAETPQAEVAKAVVS